MGNYLFLGEGQDWFEGAQRGLKWFKGTSIYLTSIVTSAHNSPSIISFIFLNFFFLNHHFISYHDCSFFFLIPTSYYLHYCWSIIKVTSHSHIFILVLFTKKIWTIKIHIFREVIYLLATHTDRSETPLHHRHVQICLQADTCLPLYQTLLLSCLFSLAWNLIS